MIGAPAYVDFETRSRAELSDVGGRRYAEHPSTEVICAVLRWPNGSYREWWPGEPEPYEVFTTECDQVVAHNAMNFDRHIWRKLGWPEPKRWIDTAELAKVAGYHTASLEALAEHLLQREKDMTGNALTLSLSDPLTYSGTYNRELEARRIALLAGRERLRPGELKALKAQLHAELDARLGITGETQRAEWGELPELTPDVVARVVAYCRTDVEIMVELYEGFLGQWLDSDLPGLEAADRALNDRGICFDRDLARLLIDVDAALAEAALQRAGLVDPATGGILRVEVSPQRLGKRLAALGVHVDNCQADTLDALLKAGATIPVPARLLIEARQASSSIAAGKLRAGLARCSEDGRLRDNRTYMGAHTGRWSGVGMQLDNLAGGD